MDKNEPSFFPFFFTMASNFYIKRTVPFFTYQIFAGWALGSGRKLLNLHFLA